MAIPSAEDAFGSLTEPEWRLIAAARAGEVLNLDPQATIRAVIVRALVCAEVEAWPVAPEGVRVVGGRIEGLLALAQRELRRPLWIHEAEIPAGIDLTASRASVLSFKNSRFDGGFEGSHARIDGGLILNGAVLRGGFEIAGATITGQLSGSGATFDNPKGYAIRAQGSRIAGMFLNHAIVNGICDINAAVISEQFSSNYAKFNNPGGHAINAQSSQIAGMFLNGATLRGICDINTATISGQFSGLEGIFDNSDGLAINAQDSSIRGVFLNGATVKGGCDINRAAISGHFCADGATFDNPNGYAIRAQDISIVSMFLNKTTLNGACDINAATIAGQFSGNGATFHNPGGHAINAQGSHIAGMFLNDATLGGVCDINAAVITGQFSANGAIFDRPDGQAIRGDHVKIGAWFMRPGSPSPAGIQRATRVHGAIILSRATIERHFEIWGVELTHTTIALNAHGIEAAGPFLVGGGTRIVGGANLSAATVHGRLDLSGSRLVSVAQAPGSEGPRPLLAESGTLFTALDLSEARVDHLVMPWTADDRPKGIVDLSRARIGTLTDFAAAWPRPINRKLRICRDRFCDGAGRDADHLILDGFEYEHLDNPDGLPPGQSADPRRLAKIRRNWLHAQSREDLFDRLKAQPWRHLAKILAAQGYEEEARRVAIERRVAQRYAIGTGRLARGLSWLLHTLADYGFNPWKALGWSGGVIAVCAIIYAFAAGYCTSATPVCADETAFVRTTAADFVPAMSDIKEAQAKLAATYPAFDPLAYSIDVFLPFFDIGTERFWRVNTATGWGIALYYFTVLEQIAGALLVSLVVTGFTGLLTRNEA